MVRWPVLSITSCSSTPDAYSLVAAVALREWFVLKPWRPASLHMFATEFFRELCPTADRENQQYVVHFVIGVR